MAWILDEYEVMKRTSAPGVITGKPLILGGSHARYNSTARGAIICVREAAKKLKIDLNNSKFAVQGFGNASAWAASLYIEYFPGSKLVGCSDSRGSIICNTGMDIAALREFKAKNRTVVGFPGSETVSREELFAVDCDVFLPGALEGQIDAKIASSMKCKILSELANGPTKPKGDQVLSEKGVFVIPDVLANSGGVTVSYFEQVQNSMNYYWEEDDVNKRLDKLLTAAFSDFYDIKLKHKLTDNRQAAFVVGISKIYEAEHTRGRI